MKNIIALSAFIISLSASATTMIPLQEIAKLDMGEFGLKSVVVNNYGYLKVENFDGEVARTRLSARNLNQINWYVKKLSTADISREINEIPCMFIRAPYSPNLYTAKENSNGGILLGALRLVLGPQHCGVDLFIQPRAQDDNAVAESLKTILETLGTQVAQDHNLVRVPVWQ